jgi:glutamate racemase
MDAIGVFDSGVGGLTVVAALRRRLPRESILYLGDTARLPYGSKSPATVIRYTQRNVAFLVERGVKAVVVACNTASALALPELALGVPTWGVIEPGAERAAAASGGHVGVIATEATVRSDAYPRALRRLRPELAIASRACPLFVPLVEEGWHDDPITEQVAARYLAPLLAGGVDTLVLGCTHYPLLAPVLARVAGPEVLLVDSAEAVAEAVAAGLAERGLAHAADPAPGAQDGEGARSLRVCVTDAGPGFQTLARRILGSHELCLEWVEVV